MIMKSVMSMMKVLEIINYWQENFKRLLYNIFGKSGRIFQEKSRKFKNLNYLKKNLTFDLPIFKRNMVAFIVKTFFESLHSTENVINFDISIYKTKQ